MKTDTSSGTIERRQLELVQRIGRIGYWEYVPEEQSVSLAQAAVGLLSSILACPPAACPAFVEALSEGERKRFQVAVGQAVAGQLALNIELKLARRDGRHAYIVVRGAPVEDSLGAQRFAGTFQDITNEKNRDADHEKLITQLQALLDALPQGVSVIDKDLRLILWNRRFHEVLDFPQDLVFRHARFEDFIRLNAARGEYGPGDPEAQVQAIVARAREFVPHHFERQLTGGRTILVEGYPFKSGGEISGFVTTYTDITDQKRSEDQLTRQRDVMKTIIDNFPGAISLCDADLRMTAFNDQIMELLDFPQSLFAKGWVAFEELARFNANRGEYGPGDPEEQVQAIVKRAHNFQAHRIERARPNGRWLEIRGTPVPSGGFVTSYIDITERKRMEAELVHSKEVAEARREQVASLLDNSGQGFLSFGSDLIVDAECSRACETMLGLSPAGQDAAQVLFAADPAKADLLRATVETALGEDDPWLGETMLSLLPGEFPHGDRLLKAEYKRLENKRVMVVLTDITEERRLEKTVQTERRRLEMIVAAVTDSRDFFDTVEAFREFVAASLPAILDAPMQPAAIAREIYRQVHTFKGLLNQFSFPEVPAALHDLESRLEALRRLDRGLSCRDIADAVRAAPLMELLDADLAVLRDALGPEFLQAGDRIVLSAAQAEQLSRLTAQLLRGECVDTTLGEVRNLLRELGRLHKIPVRDVLTGFNRLIRQTAARLEKEVAPLEVHGGMDVWIDPGAYRPFLRSLPHVFRNAVVHGIEDPDTRLGIGKQEAGTITCSVNADEGFLKLSIADDGAGVDIAALRRRAVAAGLFGHEEVSAVADEQILDLIFLDNIGTQQEATELAGRGVGLAVVRNEARNLMGDVIVRTAAGKGTQFVFNLPLQPDMTQRSEAQC